MRTASAGTMLLAKRRRGARAPRVPCPAPSPDSLQAPDQIQLSVKAKDEMVFGEGAENYTRGACAPLISILGRGGQSLRDNLKWHRR